MNEYLLLSYLIAHRGEMIQYYMQESQGSDIDSQARAFTLNRCFLVCHCIKNILKLK